MKVIDYLAKELNKTQRKALDISRPMAMEAGPGSGKTRAFTHRYVAAIDESRRAGLDPLDALERIVAITFTRRAAAEMKGRTIAVINKLIEMDTLDDKGKDFYRTVIENGQRARISTFHSFCHQLLARNPIAVGLAPHFALTANTLDIPTIGADIYQYFETAFWDRLPKERSIGVAGEIAKLGWEHRESAGYFLLKASYAHYRNKFAQELISSGLLDENTLPEWENFTKSAADIFNIFISEFVPTIVDTRTEADFPQLELKLLGNETILKEAAQRTNHLLVDEFQDTNPIQWQIIKQIVENANVKLFVVGDAKQAIYGFRDADVKLFERAKELISKQDGTIIPMDENYRSAPPLVTFFNSLAQSWQTNENSLVFSTPPQILTAERTPASAQLNSRIERFISDNHEGQARAVISLIKDIVGKEMVECPETGELRAARYGDVAILLRKKTGLLSVLRRHLKNENVPFNDIKEETALDSIVAKELLAVLLYLATEEDAYLISAFLTALLPVDDAVLGELSKYEGTLIERIRSYLADTDNPDVAHSLELINKWMEQKDDVPALVENILSESLAAVVYDDPKTVNSIIRYAKETSRKGMLSLPQFIAFLSSPQDEDALDGAVPATSEDAVTILTAHKAKGTEFPVVIVPELGAKLPSDKGDVLYHRAFGLAIKGDELGDMVKRLKKASAAEEEKRLFYVAVTRARDHLFLGALRKKTIKKMFQTNSFGASIKEIWDDIPEFEPKTVVRSAAPTASVYSPIEKRFAEPIPPERGFSFIYPSELGDISVVPRRAQVDRDTALKWGTVVHRALAMLDAFLPDEIAERMAGLSDDERKHIAKMLDMIIKSDVRRFVLSPDAMREYPFLSRYADKIIAGRIDLVVPDGDRLWVIDYKTVSHSPTLDDARIRYGQQLSLYQKAVQDATGMAVSVAVIAISDDSVSFLPL